MISIVFYTGNRVYPYGSKLTSITDKVIACSQVPLEVNFILVAANQLKQNTRGSGSCYSLGLKVFQQAQKANEQELMHLVQLLSEKHSVDEVEFARMGAMMLFSQNALFEDEAFIKKVSRLFGKTLGEEVMGVGESLIALGKKRGFSEGVNQGVNQGVREGLMQGLSQARHAWFEANQAITDAMIKQGLPQEAIDAIISLSQSKLNAMAEEMTE